MNCRFSTASIAVGLTIGIANLAAPASAQMAVKAPPAAPASLSWTGSYLGGGVGYGTSTYNTTRYSSDAEFSSAQPQAGHGAFLAAIAGYDWQFASRLVAGIMIDGEIGGPQSEMSLPIFHIPGPYHFRRESAWSVGGRLGFLATPDTLVYVPGGYTQSRYSWQNTYFSLMLPATLHSATAQGWFTGFGLETRLGGNWSLRGEYRYAWLGDICVGSEPFQTASICRGANDALGGVIRSEQLTEQSARLTLAYRFQGWGPRTQVPPA